MALSIPKGPQRIVCLTEEPTEILYALGEGERVVGISAYTIRPPEAREENGEGADEEEMIFAEAPTQFFI